MNKDLRLADVLSRHMEEAGIKDARLATLVNQQHPQLGLSRSSVRNWRKGHSKKARDDWRPIAAIAGVFRLDEAQASELLQAASQPPIAQLLAEVSNEQERELLSRWATGARTVPFLAPPLPPHTLVGRDEILDNLKKRLFAGGNLALSALNGLPGVGKTALAVALAHDPEVRKHFYDGVLWAGLGREADEMALLGRWASALGIGSDELSKLTTVEARVDRIHATIGDRRILLVADDAWDVKAALAFKVGGPNCSHLVTTRIPEIALRFAGDGAQVVHELSEKDGLALLTQLAPQVVAAEPEEAQELVKAVGGLPLALVLMGNYLRVQGRGGRKRRIRRALQKLEDVQERLQLEQQQAPTERHPSLAPNATISVEAIIAITDETLDDSARRAFYALSVLPPKPNTFSEEAAEAVSDEPVEALDTLTDYGLLEESGDERYTLHQTIADYARLKLTDEVAYERMVSFFVDYVKAHEREYKILEPETNNVLAALEAAFAKGMPSALVQGTNLFCDFMEVRGLYELAETYLKRAEQTARTLDDATGLLTTLLNLGRTVTKQGNYTQAEAYFKRGLALAREFGHPAIICQLLLNLGEVATNRGAYNQAQGYYQEGLALMRAHGGRIRDLKVNLGIETTNQAAYDWATEEEANLRTELALASVLGDRKRMSLLFNCLGSIVTSRGAYDKAQVYSQKGLSLAREIGDHEMISRFLTNLGTVAAHRGAYKQAKAYLHEAVVLPGSLKERQIINLLIMHLDGSADYRGIYEQAEAYFQEGLTLAQALGDLLLTSFIFTTRGELLLKLRSWDLAEAAFREALEIAQKADIEDFVAKALYGLAQVEFGQAHIAKARRLGEESLAIFEKIGHGDAAEVKKWLAGLPTDEKLS